MFKLRVVVASVCLTSVAAACSGGSSQESVTTTEDAEVSVVSVSEATTTPPTTTPIPPISNKEALIRSYGVEMFPDSDGLATSLLSAGLLPMVGPQSAFYEQHAPLCAGLPLSVHMPLESGDSLQIVAYKSVGIEETAEDKYFQTVTISLIEGLSESEYLADITRIRAGLDADLRCSTQIYADNGESIEHSVPSLTNENEYYTFNVDTGDNGFGLTRVFAFLDEEILCTTKSNAIGIVEATTQVRIGTVADEGDHQYGAATFIFYLPSFELGLVVNAVVGTDQFYGANGDSTVAFEKALALGNEFASSVSNVCVAVNSTMADHDMGVESDWSPTPIPSEV